MKSSTNTSGPYSQFARLCKLVYSIYSVSYGLFRFQLIDLVNQFEVLPLPRSDLREFPCLLNIYPDFPSYSFLC